MNEIEHRYYKRMWAWIPSLYFTKGLPYVTIMILSLIFLKQKGVGNADITFCISWLYLPWVIKPLWKPFVDRVYTHRWWILFMQVLLGASLGGLAFIIPTSDWFKGTLFFFWIIAFSSSIHNTAVDDLYRETVDKSHRPFALARSLSYRLATAFGQGVLVMLAGNLQVVYRYSFGYTWSLMFYGAAGIVILLGLWHFRTLPYTISRNARDKINIKMVWQETIDSLNAFFSRPHVMVSFLFILLYCVPESLINKISVLFLIDSVTVGGLGLSPQEYGLVQGTLGVIGLCVGGYLGGKLVRRDGLKKWIWPMTLAMTLPNLVYVYLSYSLTSSLLLISLSIFLEQFGYGFGFIAYLSYINGIGNDNPTDNNRSLCKSVMALSMMIPGLTAGALQEALGYFWFFVIVMICCIFTFVITPFLKIDPNMGKQSNS